MNGIDFKSFYNTVKNASVLDGDMVIQQDANGAARLKKVNYGSTVGRLVLGLFDDHNTMSTVEQNILVRSAFLNAVSDQLAAWSVEPDEAMRLMERVRSAIGRDDTKPLSRRAIRAAMAALTPEKGMDSLPSTKGAAPATGPRAMQFSGASEAKRVGTGSGALVLTEKQFNGMMEQAQYFAEKRALEDADYKNVGKLCRLDPDTTPSAETINANTKFLFDLIGKGKFPKASEFKKGMSLLGMSPSFQERKDAAAKCAQLAKILFGESLSPKQLAVVKTMVAQAKRNYQLGRLQGNVSELLADGSDTVSLCDALVSRAKANNSMVPRPANYAFSSSAYAKHKVHTASCETCERINELDNFIETHEAGKIDEIVKFDPDSLRKKDEKGKVRKEAEPEMKFWADLMLNEDPLEVEISQLKGGERIGRVFYQPGNFDFLSKMCSQVANGHAPRLPKPFDSAAGKPLADALAKMCATLNKTLFGVQGGNAKNTYKFDVSMLQANPEKVFEAVKNAGVEAAIDASLKAVAEKGVLKPVLEGLGLDRAERNSSASELSVKEQMVKLLITSTVKTASPAQLRNLFASGFRNSHALDEFEPMATMFAAGPLVQKMLQGIDTAQVSESAKAVLSEMLNAMPPVSEKVLRAELFDIVNASRDVGGQRIANIEIKSTLGAATIGQTLMCQVDFVNDSGVKAPRECVLKFMRPGVAEALEGEAKTFRAFLTALKRNVPPKDPSLRAMWDAVKSDKSIDADALAREMNAIFTTTVQAIRQETHFDNEMVSTIRGVRAYAKNGGEKADIDSMLPLLKDQSAKGVDRFLKAVKNAEPFDTQAIKGLIAEYCVAGSGATLLLTRVEGETLRDFTKREKARLVKKHEEIVTELSTEGIDPSTLARNTLTTTSQQTEVGAGAAVGDKPNDGIKPPDGDISKIREEYAQIWDNPAELEKAYSGLYKQLDGQRAEKDKKLGEKMPLLDSAKKTLANAQTNLKKYERTQQVTDVLVSVFAGGTGPNAGNSKVRLGDFAPEKISPENRQKLLDAFIGKNADAETKKLAQEIFGPRPTVPPEDSIGRNPGAFTEAKPVEKDYKGFFGKVDRKAFGSDLRDWEQRKAEHDKDLGNYNEAVRKRNNAIASQASYDANIVRSVYNWIFDAASAPVPDPDKKEVASVPVPEVDEMAIDAALAEHIDSRVEGARKVVEKAELERDNADQDYNLSRTEYDEILSPLDKKQEVLRNRYLELTLKYRSENEVPDVSQYKSANDVLKLHRENLNQSVKQVEANVMKDWEPIRKTQQDLQEALQKLADGLVNGKPPFLHGDSHGGNIMRKPGKQDSSRNDSKVEKLEDSVLVFIDYGRGTEVSEKEAHALARLLAVATRPEYKLADVALDAYRILVNDLLERRAGALSQSQDPNDQAELELLRESARLLDDPQVFNRLAADVENVFSDGADAMDRISKFCDLLARQGMLIPNALQAFLDSVVKTFNAEREIESVTVQYREVAESSQLRMVSTYLNSVIAEMETLKSPVLGENGEMVPLFPDLGKKVVITPELLSRLDIVTDGSTSMVVDSGEAASGGKPEEASFMSAITQMLDNTSKWEQSAEKATYDDFSNRFYGVEDDIDFVEPETKEEFTQNNAKIFSGEVGERTIDVSSNLKINPNTLDKEKKLLNYHVQNLRNLIFDVVKELKNAKQGTDSIFKSSAAFKTDFDNAIKGSNDKLQKDVVQQMDGIVIEKATQSFELDPAAAPQVV